MSDQYMRDFLRVAVSQVCLTIGYHVIQGTPLELLQDTLHKFLNEFARDLKRQVEHYNRIEVNLDDTFITLSNLNVNINELLGYMNNVEPAPLAIDLPRFPAHKNTNLNFLKPGSKEVLIRPVHIYEYLPPMLPKELHYLQSGSSACNSVLNSVPIQVPASLERYRPTCSNSANAPTVSKKRLLESKSGSELSTVGLKTSVSSTLIFDDEGRPTREISSVVMTTGGFISPAVEGKLADTLIPKFVEKLLGLDAPPPISPPPKPIVELNWAQDHKPRCNTTSSKEGFNDTVIRCPVQPEKVSTIKSQLLEGDRQSICLELHSQEASIKENVTVPDVVNSIVSKKSVQSHLTQHVMQGPTLASKLLKKAKKNNALNFQNLLTCKPIGPEQYNSEATLVPCRTAVAEKEQRKNNNMQKMFKSGMDPSAMSTNYSNTDLQRLKIEKFLKKQSKQQKKLLHRQKNSSQSKKNSNTNFTTISENKLSLKITDSQLPIDVPFMEDSVSKEMAHIYLPTQNISQITLPGIAPQSIMKDKLSTDDSRNINEVGLDSTQMPAIVTLSYDKKSLPEAKLSAELDRNKLNIFKKISKPKTQKSSNVNHITSNNGQVISLPCGTTITPAPATLVSTELTESSLKALLSCNFAGPLDLANSSSTRDIMPNVLSNLNSPVEGLNKPKKRGRKPGSKNLPKPAMVTPKNSSDIAHLSKVKKFKNSKYDYPYPLLFDNANLVSNKINTGIASNNLNSNICHGEYVGASVFASNINNNRKERKKTRSKSLLMNIPTELNLFKTDAEVPSKEEVNTINKKLMRMDTVLQTLGTFNQTPTETDIDITKLQTTKSTSSSKSSTFKNRLSPQGSLQQPDSNIIPILHPSTFLPPTGLVRMPELLKLCPFPPGPGLIPPTAQNLLFPRLRSSFPLTLPNFQPFGVVKPINPESPANDLDHFLSQRSGERNYCNVPPLVPESMKLSPPICEIKNQQSNTYYEQMSKTLDNWNTHEKSKSIPPGGMSLKTCELHLQSELRIKSPKESTGNQAFSGGVFSQNTSTNTALVKSSIVAPMLNTDDPIELSDDSVECSATTVLDMLPSGNRKELNLLFPQMEDYVSISKDPTSYRDQKKLKKANKFIKNSKKKFPISTDNLPQLDLLSTDKGGVGKLAGGADLIPLISTGSAYSSITIPSTSLTATVASSFSLSKADIYPVNAFENPLSSTNIEGNEVLPLNMELQKKKKDHKRLKKLKEDKVKKKKDKKSKNRDRFDNPDKSLHRSEKTCKDKLKETLPYNEEQQLMKKDLLKKLKKEKKKKYKQLIKDSNEQANMTQVVDSIGMNGVTKSNNTVFLIGGALQNLPPPNITSSTQSFVPKITLKLSSSQSPTPVDDFIQKHSNITSIAGNEFGRKKEPSPELARISPLITRPPKQKFGIAETVTSTMNTNPGTSITAIGSNSSNSVPESKVNALITPTNANVHSIAPPPSPWSSGGTISASSVLLPQQLLQSSKILEHLSHNNKVEGELIVNSAAASRQFSTDHQIPVPLISESNRPSSYIDAEGNRVWICPACGKVDDGSPMIGCDGCDAWYHWICVGISVAPKDNEDWFCRVCITRKKGVHATDKKRKRNKKSKCQF